MNTKSYSEQEARHFRQFSHCWWDEAGPFRALHLLNPLRMAFLKNNLLKHFNLAENSFPPLKGLRILDIGCGGGLLSEPLARLGAKVTAIDMVEENILAAKEHASQGGLEIDYQCASAESLYEQGEVFDAVISMEVIEHVENASAFLNTCTNLVSKGGALSLSTLNKTWQSYLFGIIAAEYILKWAPRGTHHWEKFIPPHDLITQLNQLTFTTSAIKGLHFSLTKRLWCLNDNLDINYILFATMG